MSDIVTQFSQVKPRVCVLYTGGTIGMVQGSDGLVHPPKDPRDFLDTAPEIRNFADVDFEVLMNKDSTNIIPSDWTKMAQAVYERRHQGYDGFVIAHGTDTMHFSASAMAFALGPNLNFPVVFTGAQTIAEVLYGDARINLIRAVRVACEDLAEVVISFGDHIYRGCRTQKNDERQFRAFSSPAISPVGDITAPIHLYPIAKRKISAASEINFQASFASGILQIPMTPGLEPKLITPVLDSEICRGIVLQAFGAGNIPDEPGYSFYEFIQKATELGKPVIIISQFPANSTLSSHYLPGKRALEAGAIPTGNMTNAAAIVKFRWVLSTVNKKIRNSTYPQNNLIDRVRSLMDKPYVSEME